MADRDKVIDQFFGDATTPIEWKDEDEKKLHFWLDDLHCPQPISPMWFDIGGWWLTCGYMYRRFGVPFGKDWVAKTVNGYLMSAVVPRPAEEEAELWSYYNMVMPVYADKFLDWWKRRYLPEILRNFEYLDTFPMESSSLPELMILLEEAIDIQERHWRLHWMLNLAQFQASITFESVLIPLIGEQHKPLVGRILISDEDRNWDSVRELWTLKEKVKKSAALKRAFDDNETADGVMRALGASEEGRALLKDIDEYKNEYGNKSMYAHEYLYTTWRENPTPIVEALRGYLLSDYDYEKDVRQLRANRDAAIKEMWSLVPAGTSQEDKRQAEDRARSRVEDDAADAGPSFLYGPGHVRAHAPGADGRGPKARRARRAGSARRHHVPEIRRAAEAQRESVDVRRASRSSRSGATAREKAFAIRPRLWAGTITDWSMYGEPYKQVLWDWPGIYERSKDAASAAVGIGQGAWRIRRRLRRHGARRRVGRAVRPGEERRSARLQDDEPVVGRAVHEDRRARHRFRRRALSSGRRVARVRHSGCRRHANGNAGHQDRTARAAERSIGAR